MENEVRRIFVYMVERSAVAGSDGEAAPGVQPQAENKVHRILWIKPFVAVAGINLHVQFDHEMKNPADWKQRARAVNKLMADVDVEFLGPVPRTSHQVHQKIRMDLGALLHPLRNQGAEAAL